MTGQALALRSIDDIQRVSKAYAMSGYWPDSRDVAQAFVKVSFGVEVGLPAYVAMSEVHIIQGKPTLGAGALAGLVKGHPAYDYRVTKHDTNECEIEFYELADKASGNFNTLGVSRFTMDDARTAGLTSNPTWKKYPRNMLFARAISNGVAWFCPDVTMGRVYTPDEMSDVDAPAGPDEMIEDAAFTVRPEPTPAEEAVEPADVALWQHADRLEAELLERGAELEVDLSLIRESIAAKRGEAHDAGEPEVLVEWLGVQVDRAVRALAERAGETQFRAPTGPRGGKPTAGQVAIFKAAQEAGLSDEERHRITAEVCGVESSRDVPRGMVDAVVAALRGAGVQT